MAKPTLDGELMFPSEYLAAEEFSGKDVTLTIKDVQFDDMKLKAGGKKRKPVLFFHKTNKKLVLNVTNANTIGKIYNEPEARNWIGKRITFFPTTCEAFGEIVNCIRVRPKKPTANAAEPEQRPPSSGTGAPVVSEGGEVLDNAEAGAPEAVPDEGMCRTILDNIRKTTKRETQRLGFEQFVGTACYDMGNDPASIKPFIARDRFVTAAETIMRWQGWL